MIYESASVLRHVKFSQDQKRRLKQWPRRKVKFKDELQKNYGFSCVGTTKFEFSTSKSIKWHIVILAPRRRQQNLISSHFFGIQPTD